MQGGTNKWKSKDPSVDFAKPVKQGLLGWPKYIGSGGPTTSCGTAYILVPPKYTKYAYINRYRG
jgi:hypothetical protein